MEYCGDDTVERDGKISLRMHQDLWSVWVDGESQPRFKTTEPSGERYARAFYEGLVACRWYYHGE